MRTNNNVQQYLQRHPYFLYFNKAPDTLRHSLKSTAVTHQFQHVAAALAQERSIGRRANGVSQGGRRLGPRWALSLSGWSSVRPQRHEIDPGSGERVKRHMANK